MICRSASKQTPRSKKCAASNGRDSRSISFEDETLFVVVPFTEPVSFPAKLRRPAAVLLFPLAISGNVVQICSFALSVGSSRECVAQIWSFTLSIGSSRECGSNLEFYSFHWQFRGTWPISAVLLSPGEISDDEGGVANDGYMSFTWAVLCETAPAIVLLHFKQQYNYPSETDQAASFPFTWAVPEKNCDSGCLLFDSLERQ